ncbi:MAG TPA: hypothetical protein VJQ59_09855 [Candidatus Sulfotelmatobacter sp.]|nr:hypothetical protein [Candidatus Sulfotelmatobacter sp.]
MLGTKMPMWSKVVIRVIGTVDAILSAFGMYLLSHSVFGAAFALKPRTAAPYFRIAFASMTAVNAGFLVLFALGAFQLLRLRSVGIVVHAVGSGLLVGYGLLIGILWLDRSSIGRSIAAATGVANMGVSPFELLSIVPYAYPIASTVVLLVTRSKTAAEMQTSDVIGAGQIR